MTVAAPANEGFSKGIEIDLSDEKICPTAKHRRGVKVIAQMLGWEVSGLAFLAMIYSAATILA